MVLRVIILVTCLSVSASYAQESSRDNLETMETWRIPIVRGGYPVNKFPKAKISGEKPVARDIGGKKNLTLEEFNRIMDRKVDEFYKRIQREVNEDRRMERIMKKPKYSDPSYFGHKRKPRKRPPGKRKICRECGIVH